MASDWLARYAPSVDCHSDVDVHGQQLGRQIPKYVGHANGNHLLGLTAQSASDLALTRYARTRLQNG